MYIQLTSLMIIDHDRFMSFVKKSHRRRLLQPILARVQRCYYHLYYDYHYFCYYVY